MRHDPAVRSAGGYTGHADHTRYLDRAHELGYEGKALTEIPCLCKQCKEAHAEGVELYTQEEERRISKVDGNIKSKIIYVMRTYHAGQPKALNLLDLLREVYGDKANVSESNNNPQRRKIRQMIEQINADGGLVCSSPDIGYWWAASLDDGLEAAERNRKRALTQLDNASRLLKNIKQQYGGQIGLGL